MKDRLLILATFAFGAVLSSDAAAPAAISRATGFTSPTAGAECWLSSISTNGRYVLFTSASGNLVANDRNGLPDVFRRDRQLGVTELVSVNTNGVSGIGSSYHGLMTADGNIVLIESDATDLAPHAWASAAGPLPPRFDGVYLRTLTNQQTRRLGERAEATRPRGARKGLMNDAGTRIGFMAPSDLTLSDTNRGVDLYVYLPADDTNVVVSMDATGRPLGTSLTMGVNAGFGRAWGMADDRYIVIDSMRTNLLTGGETAGWDVIVRDYSVGTNLLASAATDGSRAHFSYDGRINADGRYVVFTSMATNLVVGYVHHGLNPPTNSTDVYLRDMVAGTTLLVSANTNGVNSPTNSFGGEISPDGRYEAFFSYADDLVTNDTENADTSLDVFVYDRLEARTRLVSPDPGWYADDGGAVPQPLRFRGGGRYLVFQAEGQGSTIHDLTAGTNFFLAKAYDCDLTPDGRYVAFRSLPQDRDPTDTTPEMNVYVLDRETGITELISARLASTPAVTARGASFVGPGSISADGRWIAFRSHADDLASNDQNASGDIFLHDRQSGANRLVSQKAGGGESAAGFSWRPVLSANGRYVAYESGATNLVAGVVPAYGQVFLTDAETGQNWLCSVNTNGAPCNHEAEAAALSPDGRWVAFVSLATDLVTNDTVTTTTDVFLFDRADNSVRHVTRRNDGAASTTGTSSAPVFSSDGTWLAFLSSMPGLVTNTYSSGFPNVFLHDVASGTTRLASKTATGQGLSTGSGKVGFTPDGRFLGFVMNSTGGQGELRFYDPAADTNATLTASAYDWSASQTGQRVAFTTTAKLVPRDLNNRPDIYLLDRAVGSTSLVSVLAPGTGTGALQAFNPRISPDGRYVAFLTESTNLVAGDVEIGKDLFLRDTLFGYTIRLGRPSGGGGNLALTTPVMSPDSTFLVFHSAASDVEAGDENQTCDVFIAQFGAPDSDGDTMADDWEITYFGDLGRDGTGDADNDGSTDLAEYRAGTSPIGNASVFKAQSIQPVGGGSPVTILWAASPGRTYRVQFKNLLTEDWSDLAGDVTATTETGSKVDDSASPGGSRFYRVKLVP